jgi:hypothetical protein
MHALRRYKLRHLIEVAFKGDRGAFLLRSGLSKGRLSQLLDPKEPFGDIAARNLEERLQLDPGYFDSMNAATVEWAVKFDALPPELKARWAQLVDMLAPGSAGGLPPPPRKLHVS